MDDLTQFYLNSHIGVRIHSVQFATIIMPPSPPTWAERRRGELLWKLKRRRSIINKILFVICFIPLAVITVGGTGMLALWLQPMSEIGNMMLGIIGAELCIGAWIGLRIAIETDPSLIDIKRKRKK